MIEGWQTGRLRRRRRVRRAVLRGYREAQRGRPRRTLVSRERVGRERLRAENWGTMAVTHRRAMQMVLRMITLMQTTLALMARWHTLHDAVAERVGRRHPFLLLPSIAEPHSDYFLLELQRVRERRDLLRRGLRLLVEVLLERALHRHFDRRSLLALSSLRGDLVDARRRTGRRVCLLEPLLQQRFQLTHIFEAQLKSLEPAYCRLRENVAVQSTERETDVRLGEAKLDASLLELLGEGLEVVRRRRIFLAGAVISVEGMARVQRMPRRWTVIVRVPQVMR